MSPEEELLEKIKFVLTCGNKVQAIRLIEQYKFYQQEQDKKEIEDLKNRLDVVKESANKISKIIETLQQEKSYSEEEVLKIIELSRQIKDNNELFDLDCILGLTEVCTHNWEILSENEILEQFKKK